MTLVVMPIDCVTIRVNCEPYGEQRLSCEIEEDTPEEIEAGLKMIAADWLILWPQIHEKVTDLLKMYDQPPLFGSQPFEMQVQKSGGWVNDDFFIELKFAEHDGFWCVFFKDQRVIHHQASF